MAKLPNAEAAEIPIKKVRDYLLSATHPVGRFKAAFFRDLGFDAERPSELLEAIRGISRASEAEESERTRYGQKYVVRGTIQGPNGRTSEIITVWIVLNSAIRPRFITAYPGD